MGGMNNAQDLNMLASTGFVAKLVLLVLIVFSIQSWAIIFTKWLKLKRAVQENSKFLKIFWDCENIDEVMEKTENLHDSAIASVFRSGTKELRKIESQNSGSAENPVYFDNISRSLQKAGQVEVGLLERGVSWLATIASAAPFIGLFGTVWGIMTAFQNIGITGSANLGVVAPGISEALVTTAAGIAASIPALIAYNAIVNRIKSIASEIDFFANDYLNLLQRGILQKKVSS